MNTQEWYSVVLGVVLQMDQSTWLNGPQRFSIDQLIA